MMEVKDAVMAFSWEPVGSRFAMIHAENPQAAKVTVSFYDMLKTVEVDAKKAKKNKKKVGNNSSQSQSSHVVSELHKVDVLEGRQCNCIFWSPVGATIILASLGDSASGAMEFYDVNTKSLTVKEHYRANTVIWDPSGRTVATAVTQPIGGGHFKFAMDNGYVLWSFQGKQLYQQSFETFHQLLWRPRLSLLTDVSRKAVVKDLKKYEKRFFKEDRDRTRAEYLEKTSEKRALRRRFRERVRSLREWRSKQAEARVELLGGYDEDDDRNYNVKEVVLETTMSTKEEVIY